VRSRADSAVFLRSAAGSPLNSFLPAIRKKYVALARSLGWNSSYRIGEGLDPVYEATRLCIELSREYSRVMFFAGKLIWKRETWMQRILHNETAYQVERRLHWKGLAMSVLPVRVGSEQRTAPLMARGAS